LSYKGFTTTFQFYEKAVKLATVKYDVAIIGGGSAGISAACWSAELGLNSVLVESNVELGGQLNYVFNPINNYLGVETANGREMRDIFVSQMQNWQFDILTNSAVAAVDFEAKTALLYDGKILHFKALVIAMGVRRRKLNIAGEAEFIGKGIIESGKRDAKTLIGKTVCVIGGGDAALENALILSGFAEKVFLIHRRETFRGRKEFLNQILLNTKINILRNTNLLEIIGEDKVHAVKLKNEAEFILPTDGVIFRLGVEPNTELFRDKIMLDEFGYIKIDSNCETNVSNIFAVGDVANRLSPTISSAVGMGTTAAKVIWQRLNL
jgi:thioredoxin reductase (NADPH)